jgi:hypothetical protein
MTPISADGPDKGKGRAPPEQLAPPSGSGAPVLSGNIGSSSAGAQAGHSNRRTVGGVQIETRCANMYFLDQIRFDTEHIIAILVETPLMNLSPRLLYASATFRPKHNLNVF